MAEDLPDAPWAAQSDFPDAPWAVPERRGTVTVKPYSAEPVLAKPQVSSGRAAFEGALSGVSGNLRDEVLAASEASGLPEVLGGFRAPVGAARLAYEAATHPGAATETYNRTLEENRALQQAAREQHPYVTGAAELGGALALPVGAGAQAATLPMRIGRGAALGAGYGAISGFGAGEGGLENRLENAAETGTVGGALGVAAPAAISATGALGRGVATATKPVRALISGAINPETEAATRLSSAIQRDQQAGVASLTPEQWQAAKEAGFPVTLTELGGNTTRSLAHAASNVSPEAAGMLQRLADDRFNGQTERAAEFLQNLTGITPQNVATKESIKAQTAAIRTPAYTQAMAEGSGGLWSPELERLAGSDAVSAAMQRAVKGAKDEAIIGGGGAFNPKVTFTPDGRMQLTRGPSGTPTYPDLQFWDMVQKELKTKYTGTPEDRRNILLRKALNNELDRLIPSYQVARAGAAAGFQAEDALTAGENFVNLNKGRAETIRDFNQFSPQEQALFKQGFIGQLIDKINNTGDRINVINKINSNPAAREKLDLVLGKDGTDQLSTYLTVEQAIDRLRGTFGNSTTTRQLIELGLIGGGGGYGAVTGDWKRAGYAMGAGLAVGGVKRGSAQVNQQVMSKLADMLASNDPRILAQGVRTVSKNPALLQRFRDVDAKFAPSVVQGFAQPNTQP